MTSHEITYKWETDFMPTALEHFKNVIKLSELKNKYNNENLDAEIGEIASLGYWYHYIHDYPQF